MREEKGGEMNPKTQKNAVASGKSGFYMLKFQNILRFPVKKTGLIVKRPFPFFGKFCQKTAISGQIRLIFEAN